MKIPWGVFGSILSITLNNGIWTGKILIEKEKASFIAGWKALRPAQALREKANSL
jgi:hypothetical protein